MHGDDSISPDFVIGGVYESITRARCLADLEPALDLIKKYWRERGIEMMSTPEHADYYDKRFADHEDNEEVYAEDADEVIDDAAEWDAQLCERRR